MIRDGVDVQVIDATTGEDLTRLILGQIIADNAKMPNSVFPLDVMRQMIIDSGRMSQDGLLGYMKAMGQMYQNTFRAFAPGATGEYPTAAKNPPDSDEVHDLRRRIEELERLVERTAAAETRAGKAKRAQKSRR